MKKVSREFSISHIWSFAQNLFVMLTWLTFSLGGGSSPKGILIDAQMLTCLTFLLGGGLSPKGTFIDAQVL